MTTTMRGVRVPHPGGPEALTIEQVPVPEVSAGDVLIDVGAAGVNRPDVMQREGNYPVPPGVTDVLGLEVAGTVVAVGADVSEWRVGDLVCALVAGGGYADYCVAPAAQCLPVPTGLTVAETAGLPEACFTVWHNLVDRGGLRRGETLLVHGGSSGIGTMAIQIGRELGARVFTTAGADDRVRRCLELGAEAGFNYREQDFEEEVARLTDGKGVDVILDMVGGSYVGRNLRSLALEGRLLQIAFLEGAAVDFHAGCLLLKRLTWSGSTLRARSVAEKAEIAGGLNEHVWPLLANGTVRPLIHSRFPLEDVADAHRLMEAGGHFGKIILDVK